MKGSGERATRLLACWRFFSSRLRLREFWSGGGLPAGLCPDDLLNTLAALMSTPLITEWKVR
jgi:hypothetical protein